jgi:hypothetical protein
LVSYDSALEAATVVTLIAGRYQALDLARGDGPVRARDLETAQTVWLRDVVWPAGRRDAAMAHAMASRRIFHPSLVTLFDVIETSADGVLLAYEYVPSQPMIAVTQGQPLAPRRVGEIAAEIADAVAELHAREVVHGAIGVDTVLLTLKGRAKLDRLGDPSLTSRHDSGAGGDLQAVGDLMAALVGRPAAGAKGAQALEALTARARRGQFESAATLAALLRRIDV